MKTCFGKMAVKKLFLPFMLAVLLSACQSSPKQSVSEQNGYADIDNLPRTEAEFLKRTVPIQQASKNQQIKEIIYFDARGKRVDTPDPEGYYRHSYGRQDNGLYLMQEFFDDGRKRTDLFYGKNIYDSAVHSASGYLFIYNKAGGLSSIHFNINFHQDRLIQFCGELLCFESRFLAGNRTTTWYHQGKKIMEWILLESEKETIDKGWLWYKNGQLAVRHQVVRSNDDGNEEIIQEYWQPDGTPSDQALDNESIHELRRVIEEIDSKLNRNY